MAVTPTHVHGTHNLKTTSRQDINANFGLLAEFANDTEGRRITPNVNSLTTSDDGKIVAVDTDQLSPSGVTGAALWLTASDDVFVEASMPMTKPYHFVHVPYMIKASGHYFYSDSTSYQSGNQDFTIGCWAQVINPTEDEYILSKYDTDASAEYYLKYSNSDDAFVFGVVTNGDITNGVSEVIAASGVSLGEWYCIKSWYSPELSEIGIQVNNSTSVTAALTGVPAATSANFRVGAVRSSPSGLLEGSVCRIGVWNHKLLDSELISWYNSGKGYSYEFLPTDLVDQLVAYVNLEEHGGESGYEERDISSFDDYMVGYWPMSNISDLGHDIKGSNHLTNGGASYTTGIYDSAISLLGLPNRCLSMPSNSSISPTHTIALSCWVKSSDLSAKSSIFLKVGSYELYHDPVNGFTLDITQSDTTVKSAYMGSTSSTGAWHHVVTTADGVNISISVDGVEAEGDSYDGTIDVTANALEVGGNDDYWIGEIDEIGFWSTTNNIPETLEELFYELLWNDGNGEFYRGVWIGESGGASTETVGDRLDSVGTAHLSSQGEISFKNGPLASVNGVGHWRSIIPTSAGITPGHIFAQPSGVLHNAPYKKSDFGGLNSVEIHHTGTTFDSTTPNDWSFLHDGSPWTIMTLFNPDDVPDASGVLLSTVSYADASQPESGFVMSYTNNEAISTKFYKQNSAHIDSETPPSGCPVGEWHMVTVNFDGLHCNTYVDGQCQARCEVQDTTFDSGAPDNPLRIGALWNGTNPFDGDLSELVIIEGDMEYSEIRAMETFFAEKYQMIDSTSKLIINTNGEGGSQTFVDDLNVHTITPSGAYLTSAEKVNNTGAILIPSGCYLSIPDSPDWDFGTGAFTIEMMVKPVGDAKDLTLISHGGTLDSGNYPGWSLATGSVSAIPSLEFWNGGGSKILTMSDSQISSDEWSHIAFERSSYVYDSSGDGGSTIADCFVAVDGDNAVDVHTQDRTVDLSYGSYNLNIGAKGDGTPNQTAMYVDEIRIHKGRARYGSQVIAESTYHDFVTPTTAPISLLYQPGTQKYVPSTVKISDLQNRSLRIVSSNYVVADDDYTVLVNTSDGDKNIYLPSITNNPNRILFIRNVGDNGNDVYVYRDTVDASDLVENTALSAFGTYAVLNDDEGAAWQASSTDQYWYVIWLLDTTGTPY